MEPASSLIFVSFCSSSVSKHYLNRSRLDIIAVNSNDVLTSYSRLKTITRIPLSDNFNMFIKTSVDELTGRRFAEEKTITI